MGGTAIYSHSQSFSDLRLEPGDEVRVFTGVSLNLVCSHFGNSINEGSFSWHFQRQPCLMDFCR